MHPAIHLVAVAVVVVVVVVVVVDDVCIQTAPACYFSGSQCPCMTLSMLYRVDIILQQLPGGTIFKSRRPAPAGNGKRAEILYLMP